jgi:isochorismate pyruvate lyase
MSDVRQSVDILDKMIVDLLLERFRLMDNAATLKLDRNQVLDIQRKMAVIANAKAYAQQVGMSDIGVNTVEAIWHTLVNGCINHEFVVFDFLSGDNTPCG